MMMQQIMLFGSMAKRKLGELFSDERGEVNIVAIVVLIGIAVLLALFFKEQIQGLLESLFNAIRGNAVDAVNGGGAGGE
ncbi:MAG: flagellin-like protein [Lachnospiraceae bacterium]|nr:flagellin-like protein [Lachnospiraceae bacterium]